jgi:hypothetical protein
VIRTGSRDTRGKAVAVANVSATTRSHTFTGLVAGGSYGIRVLPITAAGPGRAAGVSVRLLAVPGAPAIAKASSGSRKGKGTTIVGRWARPRSGGPAASYQVRADRVGSRKDKTVTVRSTARSVTITGLVKNKKYRILVRGTNVAGTGSWSKPSGKVTAR